MRDTLLNHITKIEKFPVRSQSVSSSCKGKSLHKHFVLRLCLLMLRFFVPCKLMLTQQYNIPLELHHNFSLVFVRAMFQDMLNDVVAILVLDKPFNVVMQFIQYRRGLLLVAMFQDSLYYPTTIWVC